MSHLQQSIEELIFNLKDSHVEQLTRIKKFDYICQTIYHFIDQASTPCFLLPTLLKILLQINENELLDTPLRLSHFEMWLERQNFSKEKNLFIRAKISGRSLPQEEYERYFPLSMGKKPWGSHIVTAHTSPDLDTAVASFWSWLDAFAIRIGTGLHTWNLPGGSLSDQDARLFVDHFGPNVFSSLAKPRGALFLQAKDLIDPIMPIAFTAKQSIYQIKPEHFEKGVILVDENGYYLGDWRQEDGDKIKLVTNLLNSCLVWFESYFHSQVIALFAQKNLKRNQVQKLCEELSYYRLEQTLPFQEYSSSQRSLLNSYLHLILATPHGVKATLLELSEHLKSLHILDLGHFMRGLENLFQDDQLFDSEGNLIENRPHFMTKLDQCFQALSQAITTLRDPINTLEVAMKVKHEVLNLKDECVFSKAEVEEVKQLMSHFSSLTVVYPEKKGRLIPLGVIHAHHLNRNFLGTVSLRDFSNREEVKIASYLEVISIIDHHKTNIKSSSASVILISDAQSCNTLLAEEQMKINDRYSLAGQSLEAIESQLQVLAQNTSLNSQQRRLLQRLFTRLDQAQQNKSLRFFVDPQRELLEYLFYLYAILDDTDLLAKASQRDLTCVVNLLNRLETLKGHQEAEILDFDDLVKGESFLACARERIIKNPTMYALYSQIYAFKEESIKDQIKLYCSNKPNNLFCDTKTQNECARVGQLKLTAPLIPFFCQYELHLRQLWLQETMDCQQTNPHLDLFIQMISTIAGAKEVYEGKGVAYSHQDQLWIWCPMHERASEHLIHFLRGLRYAKEIERLPIHAQIIAKDTSALQSLLKEHFMAQTIEQSFDEHLEGALIILRFEAAKLNSRKAVISPYLPSLSL